MPANGLLDMTGPKGAIGVYNACVARAHHHRGNTAVRSAGGSHLDDSEREAFTAFIAGNPEAGDVIPDTDGVRKVRWGRAGIGKRGGTRVIYFYHDADRPLYLLMVYAKGRQENLSPEEERIVRKLVAILKGA
jgi:hypothetical protein